MFKTNRRRTRDNRHKSKRGVWGSDVDLHTAARTGMLLIGPLQLRNTSKFTFGGFMWFHVVSCGFIFGFLPINPRAILRSGSTSPSTVHISCSPSTARRTAHSAHASTSTISPRNTSGHCAAARRAATGSSMQAEAGDDGAWLASADTHGQAPPTLVGLDRRQPCGADSRGSWGLDEHEEVVHKEKDARRWDDCRPVATSEKEWHQHEDHERQDQADASCQRARRHYKGSEKECPSGHTRPAT